MKYSYRSYESLLIINKLLTKELFIEKAGVKTGKYAADMFSRMYDCIFSEAVYVEDDYNKYYKVEYPNLENFVYKKYCVSKSSLKKMLKLKEENDNYIIIAFDELSTGYGQFIDLIFSDELYDRFINFLLMKEHED